MQPQNLQPAYGRIQPGFSISGTIPKISGAVGFQPSRISGAVGFQPSTNIGSIYGAGAAPQVYAPKLDIAAVNAQARKAAEKAINPYYTKQLNEFLTQQGVVKQQRQTQYETDVKNLQDQLANTLQGNEITRGRTTQDVAQNLGDINTQADEFQTDVGQQFEQDRLNLARQVSTGGLGQQTQETALSQQNVAEKRQEVKFQQARTQQELFKGRTMEDLLRSDELSKTAKVKGEKQVKFDLDNYIQSLGYQEQQTRNQLEQERLQRISGEAQTQAKLRFNQYLSRITNPAQLAAAVSTYGGAF